MSPTSPELPAVDSPGRPTARRRVTDALRSAIITGEMRPGQVYSAPSLAARLGVSATPVREAMLDLEREGMVDTLRNAGFRVRPVSDAELDDIAALRILIEVPTMGAIAAHRDPGNTGPIEALRPLAERMERAAHHGDLLEYLRLDTEFHTGFLRLNGNALLVDTVRQLRHRSRLYGLQALADHGALLETTREHTRMIELALAGDEQGLRRLTRQHIEHVRTDWAG